MRLSDNEVRVGTTLDEFKSALSDLADNYEVFEATASDLTFLSFIRRDGDTYYFYPLTRENIELFKWGEISKIKPYRHVAANPNEKEWLDDMAHTSGLMMIDNRNKRSYTFSQRALAPLSNRFEAGGFGKDRKKIKPSPIRDFWLAECMYDFDDRGELIEAQWIARSESIDGKTYRKIFHVAGTQKEGRAGSCYIAPDMSTISECAEKILTTNANTALASWEVNHQQVSCDINILLGEDRELVLRICDSDTGEHSLYTTIFEKQKVVKYTKRGKRKESIVERILDKESWGHRKVVDGDAVVAAIQNQLLSLE